MAIGVAIVCVLMFFIVRMLDEAFGEFMGILFFALIGIVLLIAFGVVLIPAGLALAAAWFIGSGILKAIFTSKA